MKGEKIQPAYSLNWDTANKINLISGALFDNGSINISFCGGIVCRLKEDTIIQCKLYSLDSEIILYIYKSEIERIVGIEFHHLDEKYLVYLISQHFLKYGIAFGELILKYDYCSDIPFLAKATLRYGNNNFLVLVNLDESHIDRRDLSYIKNKLPKTLRFKTSLNIFETVLNTTEITSLTVDDIVLVYPK